MCLLKLKGINMKTFHSIYQELFFFKENSQHFSGFIKKGWGLIQKIKQLAEQKKKEKTSPNQEKS